MVLDSWHALIQLERLLFLDDSRSAGFSHRYLRGYLRSKTNSYPFAADTAATVDIGITSGGSFFSDVYSMGLLVMSDVGGIRSIVRRSFEADISRSADRFGRAGVGLCLRHALGMVEPRNIRRARHTGKPSAISLLAFDYYSYGRLDMSPGWAVARHLDNPGKQRLNSAAPQRRVERARYESAASRLLRRTRCGPR